MDFALIHRERHELPNKLGAEAARMVTTRLTLVGNVRGKVCFLVDDIIYGVDTFLDAAEHLKRCEASRVVLVATHGILTDESMREIEDCAAVDEIAITNSYPLPPCAANARPLGLHLHHLHHNPRGFSPVSPTSPPPPPGAAAAANGESSAAAGDPAWTPTKLAVIDISGVLAEAIRRTHNGESVSGPHFNFWQCLRDHAVSECPSLEKRSIDSMRFRFRKISRSSAKFAGFHRTACQLKESEDTDLDPYDHACKMFHDDQKDQFRFRDCWEILRESPKWPKKPINRKPKLEGKPNDEETSPAKALIVDNVASVPSVNEWVLGEGEELLRRDGLEDAASTADQQNTDDREIIQLTTRCTAVIHETLQLQEPQPQQSLLDSDANRAQ
ncbi:hypothetical protein HK405_014066, partial [Cladochytrium tenue]